MTDRTILKVHELTAELREILEQHFSSLWVEGEISGLSQPASGHLYFSLKDAKARLKVILFRSHRRFLKFIPKEGEAVLIRGHLSLYEPRGEYQLICDYIEPRGAGALQAAYEALKKKLREEGLFDVERKKSIPRVARRVGLITSQSGAAIQDVLKVICGGGFQPSVLLAPVPVQGYGAARKIAAAIDRLNEISRSSQNPLDLLIVTRGGGSLEDLWAFNEEVVARAIARSKIPLISAIGHESDTSLSDYVADLRAPTPSVAAEIVVKNGLAAQEALRQQQEHLEAQMKQQVFSAWQRVEMAQRLLASPAKKIAPLVDQVRHLSLRLQQAGKRLFEARIGRLAQTSEALLHQSPLHQLAAFKEKLVTLNGQLLHSGRQEIDSRRGALESRMSQLDLLSPLNILKRGYSITRKSPAQSIVRNINDVNLGDALEIILNQGVLSCRVEGKENARRNKPDFSRAS